MTAPLSGLLDRFEASPAPDIPGRLVVPPQLRAVVVAGMARWAERCIFVIVPGERDAEALVDDLELFSNDVVLLPAWETLPFEHISPNVQTMARRARERAGF